MIILLDIKGRIVGLSENTVKNPITGKTRKKIKYLDPNTGRKVKIVRIKDAKGNLVKDKVKLKGGGLKTLGNYFYTKVYHAFSSYLID